MGGRVFSGKYGRVSSPKGGLKASTEYHLQKEASRFHTESILYSAGGVRQIHCYLLHNGPLRLHMRFTIWSTNTAILSISKVVMTLSLFIMSRTLVLHRRSQSCTSLQLHMRFTIWSTDTVILSILFIMSCIQLGDDVFRFMLILS